VSTTASQPLDKLVTLLTHARRGAFAIALYDRLAVRRDITTALHERLSQPVYEVALSEQERNPIDLIRALKLKPGDVVCLCDLERAFPQALGYLDLQREVLVEMDISLVCWVTAFGHRMLAQQAPNFYAFRTTVFDFTTAEIQPPTAPRFVGRQRELKELTALLQAGGIVVLTGLGGMGKTALAQQAVRQMRSHFIGSTGWVNCETMPSLGDILLTAAVALIGDIVEQFRPDERQQRLADALRDRPCLLVLDNFETIADNSEVLRWLQTISAPSTALIVSRQRVPYLRAPTLTLSELSTDDAVTLFTQRARDAGWEGTDAEGLPRLCELVDNLPLAIELVAPRAAELQLTVLEDLVKKNLDALAREKGSARAERHQSIAACFRISFDRLSEGARTLLTRLSILPDGIEERFVAPFTGIAEWHQPIAECMRYSLLHIEQQRYRFQPLLRPLALAQLGETLPEWQRRFVAFFRQLAIDNDDINDRDKRAVLDAEWRNALAAAEMAEELQDLDAVITLSESLGDFLLLRGRWSERVHLDQRALAASHVLGDRHAEGRALNNLGIVYRRHGRWAEAEAAYQQSLTIEREVGDRHGEGQTLNNLGVVYQNQGRWAEAEAAYQQSLAICREVGNRQAEGKTLKNLASLQAAQGDITAALTLAREALQVFEATEDETAKERVRKLVAEWEQQAQKNKKGERL
jgi:tetratricopeptide (TPR) repeat protein